MSSHKSKACSNNHECILCLQKSNIPQKRKTHAGTSERGQSHHTSKPSAIFKPRKGRQYTLSVALPGSIIANALTHDSKTALAGQIARACAVFCVDEVIVFDDGQAAKRAPEENGYTAFADPNFFLYHILSYLETPPNLRKQLFPMHPDLRTAGSLPSLDMPHHMRSDEECPYREGVVTSTRTTNNDSFVSMVECGLQQRVAVPLELETGTRVTLKFPPGSYEDQRRGEASAVSPDAPREEAGYYWGYSVRQASGLGDIFTECPYDGGYDVTIGTSERGGAFGPLLDRESPSWVEPTWNHLLVVFGGVSGLEAALSADQNLQSVGVKEADVVFDHWINILPGQGSRTIRTEEAILIGLTAVRPLINVRETT